MNIFKKVFSSFLAIAVLLSVMSFGVVVKAATPDSQTVKATAGETVNIKFSLDNIYGSDGQISYSNRELFSSLTPSIAPSGNVSESRYFYFGTVKTSVEVNLRATVKSGAKVGDKAVVTFTYLRADDEMGNGPEGLVKTITVEVIEKTVSSTPSTSSSKPTVSSKPSSSSKPSVSSKPSSTSSKKPSTSSKKPSTSSKKPSTSSKKPASTSSKKPATSSVPVVASSSKESSTAKVDTTALSNQIDIADALNKKDYTSDSWSKLQAALDEARAALDSKDQDEIDAATEALKDAIAGLVRLDSDALGELIDKVNEALEKDEVMAAREALLEAIEAAKAALKNGDQDAINEAYENLTAAYDAYNAKLKELAKGEVVEIEKEVEVEPKDPYCNIGLHNLWLILFIISAVINAGFITLTVLYFVKKKKFSDDMPLVDYDINED